MRALRWIFGIVIVAVALGVAIPIGYWSLADKSRPFVEYGEPILLDAKGKPRTLWRAGETMYVHRGYCVTRILPGLVHRSILNAEVRRLPSSPIRATSQLGCSKISVPIEIPPNLSPGPYAYRVEFEHPINYWVGAIRYPLKDVSFTVVSNPVLDEMIARYQVLDTRIKHLEKLLKVPDR